ncbi:hypothetical protein Z3_59 [Bacillus phage Z3]|nr:hypothetical protein Z3_59 [Bacillus phage Z3]
MTKAELLAKLEKYDDDTVIKICNVFDSQVASFGEVADIDDVEDYTDHRTDPCVVLS